MKVQKQKQQALVVRDALITLTHLKGGATYPEIRDHIYSTTGGHIENVAGRVHDLHRHHIIRHEDSPDGVRTHIYVGPRPTPMERTPMPRITLPDGFNEADAQEVYAAAIRTIKAIQARKERVGCSLFDWGT
jgi:hypothetical protein